MKNDYFIVNIHEFLGDNESELHDKLKELINSFDCSEKNKKVDEFLKKNAINFAKKGQSVTYFVFADKNHPRLVGYFTLAIKPITVQENAVSKNSARKFSRVCNLNEDDGTYHFSAFLLAQFGKNYSLKENLRIKGSKLLEIAEAEIGRIKLAVGGIASFLECEEDAKLISFYENENYIYFGSRISHGKDDEATKYRQYIKTI